MAKEIAVEDLHSKILDAPQVSNFLDPPLDWYFFN